MNIPMLDLKAQFQQIEPQVRGAIDRVLASQHFILGPEVEALEQEIAAYLNCKHAIGVSSGSDALLMALMALDIGPGDEVITTPYTFFATVGAIARLGAKAVFVDVLDTDYNLDVSQVHKLINKNTKAILPVHLFGQSADLSPLLELSKNKGIPIIEDAAQAIGTDYQGQRVGTLGLIGCFSFFPSKNLGTLGDGGLVTTNDSVLAEKLKILRAHGSKPKYHHKLVGGNFRLDALFAAVLREKLKFLDGWTQGRQQNAKLFDELFANSQSIIKPWRRAGDRHIFNQYVLRFENHQIRERVKQGLKEKAVASEVYYPVPMHMQECFSYLGHKEGDFPVSEHCAKTTLAVPVYPELSPEQIQHIAKIIQDHI